MSTAANDFILLSSPETEPIDQIAEQTLPNKLCYSIKNHLPWKVRIKANLETFEVELFIDL